MPVDKHGTVKILPTPMTKPMGSNVKCLNFTITKAVVNIFAEVLHEGRGAIDKKHIKQDFRLKV